MARSTYRRSRGFAAYFALLGLSIGGYLLYSAWLVPLIAVPVVKRRAPVDTTDYDKMDGNTQHHVWFAEGDWERRPCAVLLTTHGKILFDDCERLDPTTWMVKPFSMVLHRNPDADNPEQPMPPIVLRSENGALLKLEQPVSAFSSSDIRLKTAELQGAVELYRRSVNTPQSDDLRIKTSNVLIEQQTVSTLDDVAFWFGNNHGMGRQLTISLSHQGQDLARDFSAIDGITHLRLGLLSSMQINPTRKKAAPNQPINERLLSTDSSPIQIQTNGDFEFDFLKNLARFRDNVQVKKLDPHGDTLFCDELLLNFRSDAPRAFEIDAASDNEYELQSIVARGEPATLTAHSQNAQVRGQHLKYDLAEQIVQVVDPQQVSIEKEDTQFVAKSIQYQIAADGRLGQLSAVGPGQLIKNDGNRPFRASWAKLLTIERRNDQQHLIQLQGKAKLDLGAESQLTSNRIHLTVWEVPVVDQDGQVARWTYQPAKLIARKRVHVSSEKIIADANELIASWPANPKPFQVAFNANLAPPVQRVRRVNYQAPVQRQIQEQPLIARGEQIRITLEDKNQQTQIRNLEMIKQVSVKKPSASDPDTAEFTVTGNSLLMTPQDQKNYRVKVSGADPYAKIQSDRFEIEGEDIFLDQTANSMWIQGRGNVLLDPKIAAATSTPSAGGSKPSQLNIGFSGGMIFDGRRIYFEHEIVASIVEHRRDSKTQTQATGNALKITLDRDVNFSDLGDQGKNSNPQIEELIFRSSLAPGEAQFQLVTHAPSTNRLVTIESLKSNLTGKPIEKFKLVAPDAVMDRTSDQFSANGPGGIEIYRLGKPGKATEGFGFVGSDSPGGSGQSITYIHTHFDQQFVSGMESKNLTVTGNTRSIYAPVTNFRTFIDPSRPTNMTEGAVRLFCDRIDLVQSDNPLSPKPKSQFTATGNAIIGADRFASEGDRIRYREDTGNLVVESLSGKNVVMRRRPNAKASFESGQRLVGSKVIYNVRTRSARAENVQSMSAIINKRP